MWGLPARFWSKVEKTDGCWNWLGARCPRGYGRYRHNGQPRMPHRLTLEGSMGRPIAAGKEVLHQCDNPPCCNPAHLREGTHAQNGIEAAERSRCRKGTGHWKARLTPFEVGVIRASRGPSRALAKILGVSWSTVFDVRTGRTWKETGTWDHSSAT